MTWSVIKIIKMLKSKKTLNVSAWSAFISKNYYLLCKTHSSTTLNTHKTQQRHSSPRMLKTRHLESNLCISMSLATVTYSRGRATSPKFRPQRRNRSKISIQILLGHLIREENEGYVIVNEVMVNEEHVKMMYEHMVFPPVSHYATITIIDSC